MDILFFHTPSTFNDVKHDWLSRSVSSSGKFEISPIGLNTLVNYIKEHELEADIVNCANTLESEDKLLMYLQNIYQLPRFFGVSLHWLVHINGVMKLIKLLKQLYPNIPVVIGGISASFFYRELIESADCDYIIRGVCAEKPLLLLLKSDQSKDSLLKIPNLVWKNKNTIQENSFEIMEISNFNSFNYLHENDKEKWGIVCYKGCRENCIYCGGTNRALGINKLLINSNDNILKQIKKISETSKKSIKLYGDIRNIDYHDLLIRINEAQIKNKLVFEVFYPLQKDIIKEIASNCHSEFEITISPDSSIQEIRKLSGKRNYSNDVLVEMINNVLGIGGSIPVFFMLGLPNHTKETIKKELEFIEFLYNKFSIYKNKFKVFFTTLSPFVDPGSRIYYDPQKYGYKLHAKNFYEYVNILTNTNAAETINYETEWLDRQQIIELENYIKIEMLKIGR